MSVDWDRLGQRWFERNRNQGEGLLNGTLTTSVTRGLELRDGNGNLRAQIGRIPPATHHQRAGDGEATAFDSWIERQRARAASLNRRSVWEANEESRERMLEQLRNDVAASEMAQNVARTVDHTGNFNRSDHVPLSVYRSWIDEADTPISAPEVRPITSERERELLEQIADLEMQNQELKLELGIE